MKKLAIIAALLILTAACLHAAAVKNVQSSQVGNRVQFTYDLLGEEREAEVAVVLTVPGDDRKTTALHLEGDVGKVKPGRGKVIWWNVLQDFPRGLNSEIAWEIVARTEKADLAAGSEYFGMAVQEITPDVANRLGISQKVGVIVVMVKDGSFADQAGIRPQDLILQVNKERANSLKDYEREIGKASSKEGVLLLIKRGKITTFVPIRH